MKKNTGRTPVHAWVATPPQAAQITAEQLEELQAIFDGQLGIERRSDGAIALYSSDATTAARLHALMAALGTFREQKLYLEDDTTQS